MDDPLPHDIASMEPALPEPLLSDQIRTLIEVQEKGVAATEKLALAIAANASDGSRTATAATPPIINVAAPSVNVQPPAVTVQHAARALHIEVTGRDEHGRIKHIAVTPVA